jgi:hypothetical protein
MMGGSGSMNLGDWAPLAIGGGLIVVAVVAIVLVRLFRNGS